MKTRPSLTRSFSHAWLRVYLIAVAFLFLLGSVATTHALIDGGSIGSIGLANILAADNSDGGDDGQGGLDDEVESAFILVDYLIGLIALVAILMVGLGVGLFVLMIVILLLIAGVLATSAVVDDTEKRPRSSYQLVLLIVAGAVGGFCGAAIAWMAGLPSDVAGPFWILPLAGGVAGLLGGVVAAWGCSWVWDRWQPFGGVRLDRYEREV